MSRHRRPYGYVEQAKAATQHAVDLTFRHLETELVQEVYAAVDNGEDPTKVTQRLESQTKKRSSDLEESIQQITADLEKAIRDELSILDARLQIDVKGIERGGLIDMQKILKELRTGLRYVAVQVADVVLKVLGVIGAYLLGPVAAIIAGALAVFGKLLDWMLLDPPKRKLEAKAKALERIETSVSARRNEAHAHLVRELERVRQEVEKQLEHARCMLDELRALGRRFGEQLEGLLAVDVELGTYVVRRVVGPEVEAAYVDLQRGTCVVGPSPSEEQLRTLNQSRCLAAPSFEGLVAAAGFERSGDWLLVPADTDELLVRMLRAYPDQVGACGVRRKSR